MKNNNNLFAYFILLLIMARIENSFSKNNSSDRPSTEKNTDEKSCCCNKNKSTENQEKLTGNHCKNQQNLHEELINKISEFRLHLMEKNQSPNEVDSFLCGIEETLMSDIE